MRTTLIWDFDETLVDASITHQLRSQSPKDWEKIYSLIPQCKLYDGIIDVLAYLTEHDMKSGVATMAQRMFAQKTLDHLGVSVDSIVGYERFLKSKPDPASILKVLNKVNADASTTIGVGDKATDIHAYRSANLALTVGCTWGLSSDEEIQSLKDSKPNYIINHPHELIQIIQQFNHSF